MASLLIAVPVLDRPQRAAPLALSARTATPDARLLFLCSPGDEAEIASCAATGAEVEIVPWECGPGDWARKINRAIQAATEDWVLFGADDLVFHPFWFDFALRTFEETDACVIGTNDLGNSRVIAGVHSTHPLVNRGYLECGTIDEEGIVLHQGYDHQFVDDELIQTAAARGTYAHSAKAVVEHLHPNWRKAADDATYRRGMAGFDRDRALFNSRRRLWEPYTHSTGRNRR